MLLYRLIFATIRKSVVLKGLYHHYWLRHRISVFSSLHMLECSWLLRQTLSKMICVSVKSCKMQQDGSALICMLLYCCCCCSWS